MTFANAVKCSFRKSIFNICQLFSFCFLFKIIFSVFLFPTLTILKMQVHTEVEGGRWRWRLEGLCVGETGWGRTGLTGDDHWGVDSSLVTISLLLHSDCTEVKIEDSEVVTRWVTLYCDDQSESNTTSAECDSVLIRRQWGWGAADSTLQCRRRRGEGSSLFITVPLYSVYQLILFNPFN